MAGHRALITGITGQDGAYLSKFLLGKGYDVYGIVRRTSTPNYWRLETLGIRRDVRLLEGDMLDECSLNSAVRSVHPDEVYNLAAQSFVGTSWQQAVMTAETDAVGTLRLLNALRLHCPGARFYQASTSELFGNSTTPVNDRNGVTVEIQDENTPFHPRSPYAIAKLYAHWMTINCRESFGLFACAGILFNHESPLRGIEFVTRKIARAVARIGRGDAETIALGNLEARRDWGFAGDYVEAIWLMLQQDTPDDFVIATGISHSIRDFLTLAFREIGIADWTPHVVQDPFMIRPAEVHANLGRSDKAKKILQWEPKVSFEELVTMMVQAELRAITPEAPQTPHHVGTTETRESAASSSSRTRGRGSR